MADSLQHIVNCKALQTAQSDTLGYANECIDALELDSHLQERVKRSLHMVDVLGDRSQVEALLAVAEGLRELNGLLTDWMRDQR